MISLKLTFRVGLRQLEEILAEAKAFKKDYVDIDVLLDQPKLLNEAAEAIVATTLAKDRDSFDVIVVGDKLVGSFGALPLAVSIAVILEKPLLIWKEMIVGVHKFFGNLSPTKGGDTRKKALILHDVIYEGNTIYKIFRDLEEAGFQVFRIVSVADRGKERCAPFKEIEDKGIVESFVRS